MVSHRSLLSLDGVEDQPRRRRRFSAAFIPRGLRPPLSAADVASDRSAYLSIPGLPRCSAAQQFGTTRLTSADDLLGSPSRALQCLVREDSATNRLDTPGGELLVTSPVLC